MPSQSGFLLGQLYTALLPAALRKSLGAYYTPPALVNRLSKQAKPSFTLEQLEPVIQRLDERCRTVEF